MVGADDTTELQFTCTEPLVVSRIFVPFSGYEYPVPEVTLPIRPVTTTPAPVPITTPSALYGAPPPGAPGGAPLRQGRRGKRQGRRVRVEPANHFQQ